MLSLFARAVETAVAVAAAFLAVAVAALAFKLKFKFGLPSVISFLPNITNFFSRIIAFSFNSDLIINTVLLFTAAVLAVFIEFKFVKSKFRILVTFSYLLTI